MMKTKKIMIAAVCSMMIVISSVAGNPYIAEAANRTGTTDAKEKTDETKSSVTMEEVEISNVEEFLSFVDNCQYDSWSVDKSIKLTADLDLSDADFVGISFFSGIFDGQGHTIRHVAIATKGSDYGFFRYLGENAVVRNLKISGSVNPNGSAKNIGGFVGVNSGTLSDCIFSGSVTGSDAVGAIAGINKATGKIINCSADADIAATNKTGGLVGENKGLISDCTSECNVNTEELTTTMDLGGLDIGNFNIAHNLVDRNDMGGIAGVSSGIITGCVNKGTIGFLHTGYNVGGIAGRQSGKVIDCTNYGELFGRKDVGGIVGQAEPYIESEYLTDRVDAVQDSLKTINSTLGNMASTVSETSEDAKKYMDSYSKQYKDSSTTFSESLDQLSDEIGESNPQAQQHVDNIHNALNEIDKIQGSNHIPTQEESEQIKNQWQIINSNLSDIRSTVQNSNKTAEDFVNDISNQLKEKDTNGDIENLTKTVDSGIQSVTDGVKTISRQISKIQNNVEDTVAVVTGQKEIIDDISSKKTAENTDGVISGSINRGAVSGDLNVGGISGSMNIEYDLDPEFDLDLTNTTNIAVRSTVNNVVLHCINYGEIIAKKNNAGGIAGLQEIGLIHDSEGYGKIKSETGDYIGGIAGNSASAITQSYSLCNIEGVDYCGGIAGTGYTIKDSVAASTIESDGEALGSIAGSVSDEGEIKNNCFVSDVLDGIDNINYAGSADKVRYEDIIASENIPEGFHKIIISFKADGELIAEKSIPYNSSLNDADLPAIPEKDGYFASWPKTLVGEPLTENRTVEAEYTLWTESISGTEQADNQKPLFLAEGKFYDDSVITMKACEAEIPDYEVVYAYDWSMDHLHDKSFDMVKGHFYVPDASGTNKVWYREKGSDKWQEANAVMNGSYLVAEIPYEASFALVYQEADDTIYYICGGAAVMILFALFLVKRYHKRKAK